MCAGVESDRHADRHATDSKDEDNRGVIKSHIHILTAVYNSIFSALDSS